MDNIYFVIYEEFLNIVYGNNEYLWMISTEEE